jgi:hypothetical protein
MLSLLTLLSLFVTWQQLSTMVISLQCFHCCFLVMNLNNQILQLLWSCHCLLVNTPHLNSFRCQPTTSLHLTQLHCSLLTAARLVSSLLNLREDPTENTDSNTSIAVTRGLPGKRQYHFRSNTFTEPLPSNSYSFL